MSAPQYSTDYVTDPTDNAREVAAEVNHHATDYDPGQGNIGGPSYGGMPDVPANPYTEPVPDTFDQSNPQLSYTRGADKPIVNTRAQGARTIRTRSYFLPSLSGDGVLILQKNPKRLYADIVTTSTKVCIADDMAGLQGLAATNVGASFAIPANVPYAVRTTGEVFASSYAAAGTDILSIIEYLDL